MKKFLLILVLMLYLLSSVGSGESIKNNHFGQGNSYLAEGRYNEAISEYKKAIKIDPKDAKAQYNLGFTYNKLGQYKQAVAYFKKALELDPNDFDTYSEAGFAYDQLGQYNEAIKYYEKALQINSKDAMMYYNIGVAYSFLKKHEEAIKYYEKALEINPNYASAYNNLGFSYTQLGQYKKAIECYEKVLRIDPNDDQAYNNIGFSHSGLGQHQEAIQYYQKAVGINPNYIAAYNNLGDAYNKLGQQEKAKENYQAAKILSKISANPDWILVKNFSERVKNRKLGLSILPPKGEYWFIIKNSPFGGLNYGNGEMAADTTHTFGCHLLIYPIDKDFKNQDEFLEWVKQSQKTDVVDLNRFKDEKYTYNLNKRFSPYCVEYDLRSTDVKRKAKDRTFLIMKVYGYVFIHPKFPKYAVDIRYSERGIDKDFAPSFQKVGNEFIDSLIIEE